MFFNHIPKSILELLDIFVRDIVKTNELYCFVLGISHQRKLIAREMPIYDLRDFVFNFIVHKPDPLCTCSLIMIAKRLNIIYKRAVQIILTHIFQKVISCCPVVLSITVNSPKLLIL